MFRWPSDKDHAGNSQNKYLFLVISKPPFNVLKRFREEAFHFHLLTPKFPSFKQKLTLCTRIRNISMKSLFDSAPLRISKKGLALPVFSLFPMEKHCQIKTDRVIRGIIPFVTVLY